MAHTFWLKHGVALLFDSLYLAEGITLAYNSGEVEAGRFPSSQCQCITASRQNKKAESMPWLLTFQSWFWWQPMYLPFSGLETTPVILSSWCRMLSLSKPRYWCRRMRRWPQGDGSMPARGGGQDVSLLEWRLTLCRRPREEELRSNPARIWLGLARRQRPRCCLEKLRRRMGVRSNHSQAQLRLHTSLLWLYPQQCKPSSSSALRSCSSNPALDPTLW